MNKEEQRLIDEFKSVLNQQKKANGKSKSGYVYVLIPKTNLFSITCTTKPFQNIKNYSSIKKFKRLFLKRCNVTPIECKHLYKYKGKTVRVGQTINFTQRAKEYEQEINNIKIQRCCMCSCFA